MKNALITWALALLILGGVAACSSGDEQAETAVEPTSEEQAPAEEQTVAEEEAVSEEDAKGSTHGNLLGWDE